MSISPSTDKAGNGRDTQAADTVQLALHLRAADLSDRAIVSNVSAVHVGTGMVFIDFGFIEQQAIADVTRAMRAGQAASGIEGRLECRVAMGAADIAQLTQQLQQVLASLHKAPVTERSAMDAALTSAPDGHLQ